MWRTLNTLAGKNNQLETVVKLEIDGNVVSEGAAVSNKFNHFFSDIGPQLASTIPSNRDANRFRTLTSIPESMYMEPATKEEVVLKIKNLDQNKSAGPDGLQANFIKYHHQVFSELIRDVFNESLENGKYPACLKTARVIPIHKGGAKTEVNNYRPISVLSVISKILEQMLVGRITSFFHSKKILYESQFGFRSGSSTATATGELFKNVYEAIDSKKQVGLLFLDLKKAFDTINHDILIQKLNFYGIRGRILQLIESFLDERDQYVSANGVNSTRRPLRVGVPQGSNLGPLLFLVYINDLPKLPLYGKPRLFADDTSLCYEDVNPNTIVRKMTDDMRILKQYFNENLLSLNLTKSKYMILHSARTNSLPHDDLVIDNTKIEKVTHFRYLGLIIDSTLKWTNHIETLLKDINAACGLLWKIKSFVPSKQLLLLYHAFIQSKMQYLMFIWGAASEANLKKLQIAQNRCLKIVYKRPRLYPTIQLYREADKSILPIKGMREQQALTIIHNHLNNPQAHHNESYNRPNHRYGLRNETTFRTKRPTTELAKNAFTYYGITRYNSLPPHIKSEKSKVKFKNLLKSHLKAKIETYFN